MRKNIVERKFREKIEIRNGKKSDVYRKKIEYLWRSKQPQNVNGSIAFLAA